MTRRATAESLPLPFPPAAPASGTRATTTHYRFVSRSQWGEVSVVLVPVRDQGGWTHEPPMVPHSDEATARAMRIHAEMVAAETRGGAREGQTETGRPEHPKVDAKRLRALLLTAEGPRDHHAVAAALGITPEVAAGALTHLRNVGHVCRAGSTKRKRMDHGGPATVGLWELTNKGRVRAVREAEGKREGRWNDGYKSRTERRRR